MESSTIDLLDRQLNTPVVIQLENIIKTYGMADTEVQVLKGVNLTIQEGEYCSIMGTSGSGKSTMMNIIGCLDRPTDGNYYLDAIEVGTLSDDELADIRNLKIGFVFQQFHLLAQLSAIENVMLPMVYAGVGAKEREERAADALAKVGLGNRMENRPNQLSGGQQQRVAIARAIVNRPVLLLADEPTGALDSRTTEEVMQIFTDLNQDGITVILVTHEPDVAKKTQRIVYFKDGEVLHPYMAPGDLHQAIDN